MTRRDGEGWRSPTSDYGTLHVVTGENGPRIDGEVPARIGCQRLLLGELSPQVGWWSENAGTLEILGHRFRLIGADGVDILVFERVDL